jgi:hypothetical protein
MRREEVRKVEVQADLAALDARAQLGDLAEAKARRLLQASAENLVGAMERHPEEARDVLRAFVDPIIYEPFGAGRERGFDFEGTGDYGALIGWASARPGVPSGTPSL